MFAWHLPQFGGRRGMLLRTNYSRSAFEFAVAQGYGLSTMSAETAQEHLDDLNSYAMCPRDWGWNPAHGEPPARYASEPQHAS
jgi:hypothetical protein